MNPLKKGPRLKLSELHPPQFLVDLYYDLHDRHLLPIVALLLVGIVTMPFLLGSSHSGEAEPTQGAANAIPGSVKTSALVVSKEEPELRDYHRRLNHLTAKDPFVQQYVSGSEEGEASSGEAASGEGSSPVESSSTPAGGSTSTEPGGTEVRTVHIKPKVVYFTYALDVRVAPISVNSKPSKGEPYVLHDLPPLTMLPSRETPALTYIGPSKDGKKALMLVSSDVTSVFGDSACVVGSQTCQLLALEPGIPETVVFGPDARTYEIDLLKIQVETTSHLNRAPLGKPKHGQKGSA